MIEHTRIGIRAGAQHDVQRIDASERRIGGFGALRPMLMEVERERNHLALAHEPCGSDDIVRRRIIERTDLVVCAPLAPVFVFRCRVAQVLAREFPWHAFPRWIALNTRMMIASAQNHGRVLWQGVFANSSPSSRSRRYSRSSPGRHAPRPIRRARCA